MKGLQILLGFLFLMTRQVCAEEITVDQLNFRHREILRALGLQANANLGVEGARVSFTEIFVRDNHFKFVKTQIAVPGKPLVSVSVLMEIGGAPLQPSVFENALITKVSSPLSPFAPAKYSFDVSHQRFLALAQTILKATEEMKGRVSQEVELSVDEKLQKNARILNNMKLNFENDVKRLKERKQHLLIRSQLTALTEVELKVMETLDKVILDTQLTMELIKEMETQLKLAFREITVRGLARALGEIKSSVETLAIAKKPLTVIDQLQERLDVAFERFADDLKTFEARRAALQGSGSELKAYELAELKAIERSMGQIKYLNDRALELKADLSSELRHFKR